MPVLRNPVPLFLDAAGRLMDGGYIYVGVAGSDPEGSPINLWWDEDRTIPATQPLRTVGGAIVNGGNRGLIYFTPDDYSIRVKNADGVVVDYQPYASGSALGTAYQPLDADLTAIAALTTTTFGKGLLTIADAAGLQDAAGLVPSLPLTGGTVTGDIARQGAGDYTYWATTGLGSGRLFLTATGASDPTSLPGDVWLTYDP